MVEIIRRETTADCGILVSTRDVLQCINSLGVSEFCAHDVIAAMWASNQCLDKLALSYAVRAALAWLRAKEEIAVAGSVLVSYRRRRSPWMADATKRVITYKVSEKREPVDCSALYLALGLQVVLER